MASLNIKYKLNSRDSKNIKVEELYEELKKKVGEKKYMEVYEFYNSNDIEFIKPVIDIDMKKTNGKKEHLEEKSDVIAVDDDVVMETTNTLKKIFGNDIELSLTKDHRRYIPQGKKNAEYKKSFHFIINNKKINPNKLKSVMKSYKNEFKYKIDTSIYRDGESKFRLPLTIKGGEKRAKNYYMKIADDNGTVEEFSKCCLTLTDGLTELNVEEKKLEKKDKKEKKEKELKSIDDFKFMDIDFDDVKDILKYYDCNEPKIKNYEIFYNVNECECPFNNHSGTNKRYLEINLLENKIYLKCHSEQCKYKKELIKDNVFEELIEFDLSIFAKLEDYCYQKIYLENRVIYLSDIAKYKQIKIDNKGNILLEDIAFSPISSINSSYTTEDGEVKITKFIALYQQDKNKKIYKNTCFYPKKSKNKKYFNEFRGFAYEHILDYDVDKEQVYKNRQDDIKFYINFLKDNACNGRDDILDYFLSLLSFYVKYPEILNHIILVLYSNEQGTGKSSFLDFLFRIIGQGYCANAEIEQVLEKHSNLGYKKIINVIEELSYEKGYNHSKKLKNKSQAETTILNEKCETMRTIKNFVHYIITTNEYKSIVLEPNDRRHFILEFKKLYDSFDLINRIDNLYNDEEFIYCFGRFLAEREEKFNYKKVKNWDIKRPITELYRLMIKRDSIEKFFTSYINYDLHRNRSITQDNYNYYIKNKTQDFVINGNDILISESDLYESYKDGIESDRKAFSRDNFIKEIIEIKKFVKRTVYKEESYLQLDLYKIKHHLRLVDKELKLMDMLKIIHNEDKPEKIKYKEIEEILTR